VLFRSKDSQVNTDQINEKTAAAGVTIDGVLVKDGNVDGRDVSVDGTKLDGIEAGADVTDAANVSAAGASMISSGAGAPGTTPAKIGNIYVDTSANKAYIATHTTDSTGWAILN